MEEDKTFLLTIESKNLIEAQVVAPFKCPACGLTDCNCGFEEEFSGNASYKINIKDGKITLKIKNI